ncbi:MFS domain-containing protein [Aphelenchoides besseyi]|nr:MFS domain-containing protein [Aphelenchoides besseyi]
MVLCHGYRYWVLLLGCLCMTSISSNMYTFNIAQVCMSTTNNGTSLQKVGNWKQIDYTPFEVSMINGVVGAGTMLATIPSTEIYSRFGLKKPFIAAGLISALSTGVLPFAAEFHLYAMLATRFIQGMSYAAIYPAIAILSSSWASLKQCGLFICVYICYTPLSSGLTNGLGGIMCNSSFGWPLVYFSHAAVGVVIFLLWMFFFNDHPHKHSAVSKIELEKIQRDKTEALMHGDNDIPYKAILSDVVIWTIWFNNLAEIFITNFLFVYAPYYISNVLRFSTETTGLFSAFTSSMQIPLRLICGFLSDKIKFVSERNKMIFFNTIGLASGGIICALVGYVPDEYPVVPVILFGLCNLATGAATVGFFKCGIIYARQVLLMLIKQYSAFVTSTCQFIKCLAVFLGPALVAIFVKDETSKTQWRIIFLITSCWQANIIFIKFCTANPAPYTVESPLKMRGADETLMSKRLSKEQLDDIERVRRNSMMSVAGAVM